MMDKQQIDHNEEVVEGSEPIKVYKTRWWILFQYSLFACLQGWCWAIPGNISDTYLDLYTQLSSADIEWFLNYGAILFLVVCFQVGYAMDRPGGVKYQLWIGTSLVTGGAVLRCFARDTSITSTILLHISYIFTALAGPVSMSAVSKVAEEWFPVSQRATATAIANVSNGFGSAMSAIVGPQMMAADVSSWARLQNYNYVMLALTVFNLVCVFVYFPIHPPTPPSITAGLSRKVENHLQWRELWPILKKLMTNRSIMMLAAVYGIGGGMQAGWGGLLVLNLQNINLDQTTANWLSFASSFAGNVLGVALGLYADKFRNLSVAIKVANVVTAVSTLYFVLAVQSLLPEAWMKPAALLPQLYVSLIFSNAAIMSYPLFFELAIEATFPCPPATVVTFLTAAYNFGAMVGQHCSDCVGWLSSFEFGCGAFFHHATICLYPPPDVLQIILSVPIANGTIFNWVYCGTVVALAVMLVAFFKESSKRFEIDAGPAGGSSGLEGGDGRREDLEALLGDDAEALFHGTLGRDRKSSR